MSLSTFGTGWDMGMDMYGDILFRPSLEMIPIVLSASAPLHTYTYISLSLSLSLFFFFFSVCIRLAAAQCGWGV